MAICSNGHEVQDGAFCVVCGVPLTPPSVAMGAPPAGPPAATPVGPPPVPFGAPAAGVPAAAPDAPFAETKPRRRKGPIIAIGAVAAVVLVGGAAFVGTQVLGGDDDQPDVVVVSEPSNDSGGDLSLVALGDELKDAQPFARDSTVMAIGEVSSEPIPDEAQSTDVVPVGGSFLVGWQDDEQSTIALIKPGEKEPEQVLYEEDGYATAMVDADHEHLVVSGGDAGCYVGAVGEELDRVARTDSCTLTSGGTVIAYDYSSGDGEELSVSTSTEVTIFDLDGEEVASFEASSPRWTTDGSHIVSSTEDEVTIIDAASGDEVASADGDTAVVLSTTGADDQVLIATTSEDEATLATLGPDGQRTDLVSGPSVTGQQVFGTDTVLGAVDDGEGSITLARYTGGGDGEPLIEGEEGLGFSVVDQEDPGVIAWNADGDVWGGSATSGDLADLGSLDDNLAPNSAVFDPASGTGYLEAYDYDADETVLLRIADGELETVLDGWSSVAIISGDASGLVVNAWDDDDDTIHVIDGTEDIEIDGADGIGRISGHGGDLVYTSFDGQEDDRVPTVSAAPADGSDDPVAVFEDVSLEGTSWIEPTVAQAYLSGEEDEYSSWVSAGGSCGDAYEWSDYDEGDIGSDGVTACIAIPAGGANLTIDIDAEIDTVLEVYDESGESVAYSDDEDDFDPYIDVYLDEGIYSALLSPYDEETGAYEAYISIG